MRYQLEDDAPWNSNSVGKSIPLSVYMHFGNFGMSAVSERERFYSFSSIQALLTIFFLESSDQVLYCLDGLIMLFVLLIHLAY